MSKIVVYSHNDFNKECERIGVCDKNVESMENMAFIDIVCTKECQKLFENDISTHYFMEEHPNVLLLEFEDIEEDEVCEGIQLKAMSREQAIKAVDFIDSNLGKDIMVCCIAGKSRSQAFYRFVTDFYMSTYKECYENKKNPCITPNVDVLAKLKFAHYLKHFEMSGMKLDFQF